MKNTFSSDTGAIRNTLSIIKQIYSKLISALNPRDKPESDLAATDQYGNHYITNIGGHSISKLDANGQLTKVVKDARLQWPDNVAISQNGYLYISVNQLNTTTALSGQPEGKPPYFIYRIKL